MKFSTAFTDTPPTGFASMDTIAYLALATTAPTAPTSGGVPASFGVKAVPSINDQTTRGKHFSPAGAITVVSGVTKEAGSPVANKKVEVYDRLTGELLNSSYSDGSGAWSLACLGRPTVRVVGSDPTTYNSVVYDNVVPV
jgi:hypothetical protein